MNTKISFLLCFCFLTLVAQTQTVTGKWYGVGQVKKAGSHSSYLSELILQQKGTRVTGEFNYYFRNAEIKTKVTGTYNSRYRLLELNANPVLNYQALDSNGADCPMEGSFTLQISRLKSSLSGQFNPLYQYRFTCPAINIKFVKQVAETTPFPVIDAEEDTLPPPKEEPIVVEADPIITALNRRSFDVPPVIDVEADSLRIALYDNGEVDHDTISVFYNRKLVAYKQMLSDKPMTFVLPLDTAINEITMFAENLGTIPPNTALAIIYAGEQRFELSLSSNFIKNAAIRFRRKVTVKDPKNIN